MTETAIPTAAPTAVPFTIDVDAEVLADLADRLDRARLPRVLDEDAEEQGVSIARLRALLEHWRHGFDWPSQQQRLNDLHHVVVPVDGLRMHAVHETCGDPAATPVVLLHGWPDSFVRYLDMVSPLLAAGHDVIVPSLPGTAFSEAPAESLTLAFAAEQVHGLVTSLGYERYAVHGGDWGAGVADALAASHADAVVALHLTDVPFSYAFAVDRAAASAEEVAYLERFDAFGSDGGEGLYYTIQSTIPTTFSVGLTDSPVALAAWHLGRFRMWSDGEPDLDGVLRNVVLHWATDCSRSAMRFYSEGVAWDGDWSGDSEGDWSGETDGGSAGDWSDAEASDWGAPSAVPTGFALFPRDLAGVPPRSYAERFYAVARFTVMPRGGHFGAMEHPEALAEDLSSFVREVTGDAQPPAMTSPAS